MKGVLMNWKGRLSEIYGSLRGDEVFTKGAPQVAAEEYFFQQQILFCFPTTCIVAIIHQWMLSIEHFSVNTFRWNDRIIQERNRILNSIYYFSKNMSLHGVGTRRYAEVLKGRQISQKRSFSWPIWFQSFFLNWKHSERSTLSFLSNYLHYLWDVLDKASDLILLSFVKNIEILISLFQSMVSLRA